MKYFVGNLSYCLSRTWQHQYHDAEYKVVAHNLSLTQDSPVQSMPHHHSNILDKNQ